MYNKKKNEMSIHSSAAEYLTYVAAVGDNADSMEMAMKAKIYGLRKE
jgi:hypothetical protein